MEEPMEIAVRDADGALMPEGRVVPSLDVALAEPLIPGRETDEAVIRLNDLGGMDFLARAPSGHELILDTDPAAGGRECGIHPKEMLLVALAGCTGMDVIAILRKKRQVVTDYRVRVAATQRADHPKVYTQIVVEHIVSGSQIDPVAVARAIELSATRYCSVSAMLSKACAIRHEFRIVPR
jgi:putative redox protein